MSSSVPLVLLSFCTDLSSADQLVFFTASGNPSHNPDADRNSTDVWTVKAQGSASSSLVSEYDGNLDAWRIATQGEGSSITQTCRFADGTLPTGCRVSIDFAHSAELSDGAQIGIRLLNADRGSEVEFALVGGSPSGFERSDASGEEATGKVYDPNDWFNIAFTMTGPTTYSAVASEGDIGGGEGAWTGSFKRPIAGIQVFSVGGKEAIDLFTDNLIVEDAIAESAGADVPLARRILGEPASFARSPDIDRRAAELLSKMTLEEKASQLAQYPGGNVTGPDNVKIDEKELAARGGIGSMLNMTVGVKGINELQRQAVEKSRLKIPILFALDVIHGYRTVYPVPLAMSASWDLALIERCARMAAVEASADGVRWTFSPMVDVAHDARWGRITEGSGEDPYLGSLIAAAWVRGYQGKDLADPTSVLACAKHFVAYGAAEGGREYDRADISDVTLRNIYLPPFHAAVDAGVGTLMSAFNTVASIPTSANHHTLREILRGDWGFRGFVVSDWTSVAELIPHGIALDGSTAALKALSAGVDMDMSSNLYASHLPELVKQNKLDVKIVDEAVTAVLCAKLAVGLFENPYTDESRFESTILKPEHIDLARQAAEQSFVLLKNDPVDGKPLLPLADGQTVALIGNLANNKDDMLGAWAVSGKQEDVVTLRQALSDRLKNKLIYVEGVVPTNDEENGFEDALAAAKNADLVIMALGESRWMSGEANARSSLDLPGKQLELLQAVVATKKPVVLVLFNGRPLAVPWEAANVPAILEAWFPGVQAGPAVVRTLFGEVNPAGRLTASFPRSVGQMPLYYNTLNTGRPAMGRKPGGGFYTGYRDDLNTALFPFGWGLTYTSFAYSPTRSSRNKLSAVT